MRLGNLGWYVNSARQDVRIKEDDVPTMDPTTVPRYGHH